MTKSSDSFTQDDFSIHYEGRPKGRVRQAWDRFLGYFAPLAHETATTAYQAGQARLQQEIHKASHIEAQAQKERAAALKSTVEAFTEAEKLSPEGQKRLYEFLSRTQQRLDDRVAETERTPPAKRTDVELQEGLTDWMAQLKDYEARTGQRIEITIHPPQSETDRQ